MWHGFYGIPRRNYAYVDPFDDYIKENGTGQEVEENVQDEEKVHVEAEHVHDSCLEEEEPIAARTRSHDSVPIVIKTRCQLDLTDIPGFAGVRSGSNLIE